MQLAKNKLLVIVLFIALIAGLYALAQRQRVESRNKAVEIAVDFTEVDALASATGKPLSEVLAQLKEAGVTSVAVQELTLNDLIQSNQAIILPQVGVAGNPASRQVAFSIRPYAMAQQVRDYLAAEIPQKVYTSNVNPSVPTRDEDALYITDGDISYLKNLPVGLPLETEEILKQDMHVVARLINYPGVNERSIDHSLKELEKHRVDTVIFGGDTVLGFRSLVPEVAEAFKANKLNYGAIEFSKQKGDGKLSNILSERLIRVHSISGAEIPNLDMPSAVERYVRAAKERNIRLLYVRLFDTASDDPIAANVLYLSKIRNNLEGEGLTVRQAHPLTNPPISKALLILIAAGVAAGVVLLLNSVVEIKPSLQAVLFILGFAFLAALTVGMGDMGRKLVALLTAVTFPTLAVVYIGQTKQKSAGSGIMASAWVRFLAATAITVCGGILVASVLSTREFMLHLQQFSGVKLAQLLPILIVAGLFAIGIGWTRDSWKAQKDKALENLKNLFSQPILVWQAAAVFAALVLVAMVLARSGNEPGVGVSPLELKFRSLLDQLLIVRPRTKEFMFGHPVIILALGFLLTGRRRWAVPLLILGTIGQVSVLNTFCHIHTPIALSLLRVLMGVVVGSVFGLAALWIVMKIVKPAKGTELQ